MSVTAQELLRRCLEGGGDPNLAAALATYAAQQEREEFDGEH